MTTESFAGGHGAPSTIAFYRPDQERSPLGIWVKENQEGENANWEDAKGMSQAQWEKLSDKQRAGLLAAVYVADADKKPGAAATLAKLRGWVNAKKGKGGGGGGGGGGDAKKAADKKKRDAEAAARKKAADTKRAQAAKNARRVRPDAVNSSHADGYIIGESENKKTRMRWDKEHSTYVVETRSGAGTGWKEARRLKPEQAYNELAKANSDWFRPTVQPYLKPAVKKAPAKTTTPPKKSTVTQPKRSGPAINEGALVSAAEVHTGAMIALVPQEDIITSIAVDGGEDPDQLHMTEVYLGDAVDIDDAERERIIDVMSDFASRQLPVEGDAFSVNMFNPPGTKREDGKDRDACVVLGIGGADVAAFHDELMDTLERANVEFPEQHAPRVPHVTLVYTDDADLSYFTDKTGPIVFDTLRIAFGGEVFDIPLGEGRDDDTVTASSLAFYSPTQKRDGDGQWTDMPGSGAVKEAVKTAKKLAKPTDSASLWKNRKDYVGKVVAVRNDKDGKPYSRLTVIEGPKGPVIRPERMFKGEWQGEEDGHSDIKSPKRLRQEIEDAPAWVKHDFVEPEEAHPEPGKSDKPGTVVPKQSRSNDDQPAGDDGQLTRDNVWDNLGAHKDKVIAEARINGNPMSRFIAREDENGPYVEQQWNNPGGWKRLKDIRDPEALKRDLSQGYPKPEVVAHPTEEVEASAPKPKPKNVEPEKPPRAENLPESFTAGALSHEDALADRDKVLSKRKKPWTEDGTLEEALAVYSEAGFANLNSALRNDETEIDEGAWGGTSKVSAFTRQLDKTMYPLPRDTVMFRQVGLNAFGLTNINDVKALEGQEFFDKAYVSTSLDPLNSIDDDSSSPIRIRITAPKGTRANYIADISTYPEEQEMLLGRGTKFKISKVTMDEYGRALVEMEVVK